MYGVYGWVERFVGGDMNEGIVVTLSVDGSDPVEVTVRPGDLVAVVTRYDEWQPQIASVEVGDADTDGR